jgi:poly(A) polymerase Pap1
MLSLGELKIYRNALDDVIEVIQNCLRRNFADKFDNGKLFGTRIEAFGSFGAEVAIKSSDIDVCVLVPNILESVEFFTAAKTEFDETAGTRNVKYINTANVPLVTFEYNGISFDVIFAKYPHPEIPFNGMELENWDSENCRRNWAGVLFCKNIHQIMNESFVADKFRQLTRIIKIWAERK